VNNTMGSFGAMLPSLEVTGVVGRTRYQAGRISRLDWYTIPALMYGIVQNPCVSA
jgi:hypothetical protein